MNFLEICQRTRLEADITGSGPASVVGQSGELEKVVEWVLTAYDDIQNLYSTWRFLRTDFTFPTIVDTQNYTPDAVDLADLATWKAEKDDDLTIYSAVADEQHLAIYPWNDFRSVYMFGTNRTQTERPTVATIKPDNSMSLWPIPNAIFTVTGEYYKKAQTLSANTDIPIIPSQFHMAIVWRAVMFYGADYAAIEKYDHGQNEYKAILRKMELNQLPKLSYGAPLA